MQIFLQKRLDKRRKKVYPYCAISNSTVYTVRRTRRGKGTAMLEIRNLTKIYRPKKGVPVKALDGVSLKLEDHGLIFILGKSGSGKSTLLNLLGGLDRFDDGEIIIKGKSSKDFTQADFDSYRNTYVGFVFQEYNILEEFTVGANIALAMELQGHKSTGSELSRILDEVDLSGYAQRKPNELSGGQKQRVAIARALIKNPEIIMADEPTGALDSKTGKQVFDTLKKLSKTKLVIVVSHDRDFAEQYGDRVIELADGRIVSDIRKSLAAPQAVSEGVQVVGESLIRIKGGYTLTARDIEMINGYLQAASGQDRILSLDGRTNDEIKKLARIDETGNREVFSETDEDALDIKRYGADSFKLIKSRLPLKNSLKIALSSLKTKPLKLVMTILLSAVAFTLFGLANTMSSYDREAVEIQSIIDSKVDYAAFSKTQLVKRGSYDYRLERQLSDADVAALQSRFPELGITPVLGALDGGYSIAENLADMSKVGTETYYSYYKSALTGFAVMTPETLEKLGYTLQGRLPSAPDEIVVTDYILEHFLKAGYVKAGETASVPVSDADGLIGKTLKLYPGGQARTFTVCGVIRTGFDSTRYESLKNTDAGSDTTIIDYMTVLDLQQVLNNSYLALGFISEDAFASLKSESDVLPVYTDGYAAALYHPDLPLSVAGYLEYGKANGVQYRLPGSSGALSSDETLLPLQTLLEAEFDHNGQKLTGGMLFERYVSEALAELDGDPTVEEAIAIRSAAIARMLGDLPEMGSVQLEVSDYMTDSYASHELRVAGFYASYSDDAADYESASEVLSVLSANGGSKYAVLADGAAEALGLQRDGLYATAVGAMPEDREGIEALVRFSIEENSDGAAYPLGNNVSYVLAQIDSILTELADVFLYIGIAFAVFSALMLMNFISSSISAKKHEIGILRAVGARGSDVFGIFFNESMIIALINWVISTLFVFLSVAGINYFFRTEFNLAITVLVFGVLQMLLILAVSALTAFIASVIPVTKISRKKPIDAIRKR